MKIWVDADACPVVIKEILFRAADRTGTKMTLVADRPVPVPRGSGVDLRVVPPGYDAADSEILSRLRPGDLVITADIPLAAGVLERGGHALNPRGEMYSADTIKSLLTMRDFMDTLRASGVDTGGPPALRQSDRKQFADQLDRFLAHNS
jgi:uncharacterized protein YaiI (UPF0178 family)